MTLWFPGGHQASWLQSFVQGKPRKSLWTRRCPQLVGERVRTDFAFSITRTQCLAFADMTPIPKKVICKGLVKRIYVWSLWQVVSLRLLRTLRFWLRQASSTASTRYQLIWRSSEAGPLQHLPCKRRFALGLKSLMGTFPPSSCYIVFELFVSKYLSGVSVN